MGREGFSGVVEVGGVLIFGEAGRVEHFCELGGFLGCVWVGGRRDGVKVQGVEESPFFIRGHEGVFHELVKGFEALDVYSDSIFVAFLCSIERVLLGVTNTTQIAHSCFMFDVRKTLSFPLLAYIYPVGSSTGLAIFMCSISKIPTRML